MLLLQQLRQVALYCAPSKDISVDVPTEQQTRGAAYGFLRTRCSRGHERQQPPFVKMWRRCVQAMRAVHVRGTIAARDARPLLHGRRTRAMAERASIGARGVAGESGTARPGRRRPMVPRRRRRPPTRRLWWQTTRVLGGDCPISSEVWVKAEFGLCEFWFRRAGPPLPSEMLGNLGFGTTPS
jgi:hypothetical protein